MLEVHHGFLVGEDLATSVVNIEVHFVPKRELFHQLPQLLKAVEQPHSSPSIEIVGLDEPNIASIIHGIRQCELSRDLILVFMFCLHQLVLSNLRVDVVNALSLDLRLLYHIEVLTKLVNFTYEVSLTQV